MSTRKAARFPTRALLLGTLAAAALLSALLATGTARAAEWGDDFGLHSFFAGTCNLPVVTGGDSSEQAFEKRDCHPASALAPQTAVAVTQAGQHPDATTSFTVNPSTLFPPPFPEGTVRDIYLDTPPGLIGNPEAVPKCPQDDWTLGRCPVSTQVGILEVRLSRGTAEPENPFSCINLTSFPGFTFPGGDRRCRFPIVNLEPSDGEVAALGFNYFSGINVGIVPVLHTDGNYGLQLRIANVPEALPLSLSTATIWGVPGEAAHDPFRFRPSSGLANRLDPGQSWPVGVPVEPFLSNPTFCDGTKPQTTLTVDSYQHPGALRADGSPDLSDPDWQTYNFASPPVSGCGSVPFDPDIQFEPTVHASDSPSGLDVDLTVPQEGLEDPAKLATANLRDTTVTLPAGVSLTPATAHGLAACTTSQIGLAAPSEEVQSIGGAPLSLSFEGQTSAALPPGATAAEVAAALAGLPTLDAADVAVSGGPGGPWSVRFTGARAGTDVPEIAATSGEIQQLQVDATGGSFVLSLGGNDTPALLYGVTAAEIQAALAALPGVGAGNVVVSGGANTGTTRLYTIAFGGGLGSADVETLATDSSLLTGATHTATVTTPTPGGSPIAAETIQAAGEIRFDNSYPTGCPDGSKIGTFAVSTPLLGEDLQGSVFLAAQGDNPFDSTFAIYLVGHSDARGLTVKLAGKVEADPGTGRLTATFRDNPRVPFSEFSLHFKGGPTGALATPPVCGSPSSQSSLASWAAPQSPVGISQSLAFGSGPAGSACPNGATGRPFGLGFDAGTASPVAGANSPFSLRLTRPDGAQEIDRIELTTPAGFSAILKGIPYCPEAAIAQARARTQAGDGAREEAAPSCPAASQIGTTTIGAGAGSSPFFVAGKAYFAGPYAGAPISLVFVVPAVAGPFDLGVQVVRTALHVDPETARITAVSDPIPQILAGIPLRIRDIRVDIDRPYYTLNPTSCDPMSVEGEAYGASGAVADLSSHFQVGGCNRLGFKPKLTTRLFGGTRRGANPRLRAVLRTRPGDANIGRVAVTLPHSEFLDQSHIRTICTRVQFKADACPPGSIYGQAEATTPLLDQPLRGNVYLRSSSHPLPDLVVALRGPASQPLEIDLAGRIDSVHGGIRTTFEAVPDAAVSKFVLEMRGGRKGLLENSRDLCVRLTRSTVRMEAQNGKVRDFRPALRRDCGKKKRRR